ncbi:hypothetical protein F2Q70_00023126 [Brassica cretica]|uniref:Uncharacterized protein n=1 Tax=Brassica cretica TaxID=69181 RepID=A0A3N6TE70_BRACR|nr:hypothetical protein F2Q70_00023126 [Brassica cretica]
MNQSRGKYQNRPIEKAEGMAVSTWPDISHLSVSRPELINVLRQMGQQVKWPQNIKAPNCFRNPGFWCEFHRDHGHKTEECVALKIEVNELLWKGHLREFLSEKAKSHLSKETTGKPTEDAPVSPPRQDRVIHVVGEKYSVIQFLQTPGRTPASGSPLEGTPVPRIPAVEFSGSGPMIAPLPPGNGKLLIRRTFHISEYGRV